MREKRKDRNFLDHLDDVGTPLLKICLKKEKRGSFFKFMLNKQRLVGLLIVVGVWIFLFCFWYLGYLDVWENKTLDWRFLWRGPIKSNEQIVIIAVDEESIKKLGHWPWPRDIHARLVDFLDAAQSQKIVFDVLFPDWDNDHPLADKKFLKTIENSEKIVLSFLFRMDRDNPKEAFLPVFRSVTTRLGFTNNTSERDGITRKMPLYLEYRGILYPSLALAAFSANKDRLIIPADLKLDKHNELYLNFAGEYQTFPYYSYVEVLEEKIPPTVFKNKIVLIGATASGLYDRRATPFSPDFPGVEIQATAINNLLEKNWLQVVTPIGMFTISIGLLLMLGLILPNLTAWRATFLTLILIFGYLALSGWLFVKYNFWLEIIFPISLIFLSYVGIIFWRFLGEEKEKRWIKKTFSHYLSSPVMEEILSHPERLRLGGERKDLTVLFSDIRGFTSLSEKMSPEEVVNLLNEYLSEMTKIVFRWGGTLDKFIGDALMAFWGAPLAQPDHPLRAVNCAREMLKELKGLQQKWLAEKKPVIDIGIGINSGAMVAGNMGSLERMDYTVIGDNVNIAARLEGLNRQFHTHILISEETYHRIKSSIPCRSLGEIKVKGKEESIKIYEVGENS